MILTKKQSQRFDSLVKGLLGYARRQPELARLRGTGRQSEQLITYYVAITEGSAIDTYVASNPDGLGEDDLAAIRSWRGMPAVTGLVARRKGEARLIAAGHSVEVCGTTTELADMVEGDLGAAILMLLPFEGRIVLANAFLLDGPADEYVEAFGGIEAIEALMEKPAEASTPEEWLALLPLLAGTSFTTERMSELQAPQGTHAGALSGMSHAEREKATDEELARRMSDQFVSFYKEKLHDAALAGSPKRDLAGCIASLRKDDLCDLARAYGLTGYSSLKKDELAAQVSTAVQADLAPAFSQLEGMSAAEIARLRDFMLAGEPLSVGESDITGANQLPEALPPLTFLYRKGTTYTLTVPAELCEAAQSFGWEGLMARSEMLSEADAFVTLAADLRGLATADQLWDEYHALRPDGLGRDQFDEVTRGGKTAITIERDLGRGTYLLHPQVNQMVDDWLGEHADLTDIGVNLYDEISTRHDSFLSEVLEGNDRFDPRPVTADMLEHGSLDAWVADQPAAKRLLAFLDAHVPNGDDDYTYGDRMLDDLAHLVRGGATYDWFTQTAARRCAVAGTPLEREFMGLLRGFYNIIPLWERNGWSEMTDLDPQGRTIFFDEDGKPIKVGRNDPCPCGSGRKYKKCHGRNV